MSTTETFNIDDHIADIDQDITDEIGTSDDWDIEGTPTSRVEVGFNEDISKSVAVKSFNPSTQEVEIEVSYDEDEPRIYGGNTVIIPKDEPYLDKVKAFEFFFAIPIPNTDLQLVGFGYTD